MDVINNVDIICLKDRSEVDEDKAQKKKKEEAAEDKEKKKKKDGHSAREEKVTIRSFEIKNVCIFMK